MALTYEVMAKDRKEKEVVKESHNFIAEALMEAEKLLYCERIWEVKVDKRVLKVKE